MGYTPACVLRFGRMRVPAALLVALLQRTPALRAVAALADCVLESPVGALIKAAAASVAALGAVDSVAGATVYTLSTGTPGHPSPYTVAAGAPIAGVAFSLTSKPQTDSPPSSWTLAGTVPPGLAFGVAGNSITSAGTVNTTNPTLTGTPTTAGDYTMTLQAWENAGGKGISSSVFTYEVIVTGGSTPTPTPTPSPTPTPTPTATAAPTPTPTAAPTPTPTPSPTPTQSVTPTPAPTSAAPTPTPTPAATPTPTPTSALSPTPASATPTPTPSPTPTSPAAIPTPTPSSAQGGVAGAPVFTSQPVSVSVAAGPVALDAFASGAATYQWMLNGSVPVPGATRSILMISGASGAAGTYTCVAANAAGSATSSPARVGTISTADVGRLGNLSARAEVGTGGSIVFAGFAVGGQGTSGTQAVLVRASGPAIALAPFNVPGTLPDPRLQVFNSNLTVINANDGWGGSAQIAGAAAAVGAFAWTNPSSHDAALDLSLLGGSYTAQVDGASGDTGDALVEVYDATPAGSASASTPRLVNLSARVDVGSGPDALFAGFVIKGSSAMTVLVRASGPALSEFGVGGSLPDPLLTLQDAASGAVIAANSGWGGNPDIAGAVAAVGAFPWGNPGSRDSAILITLPPGAYTAQVSGAGGDTGVALVEVYEVR